MFQLGERGVEQGIGVKHGVSYITAISCGMNAQMLLPSPLSASALIEIKYVEVKKTEFNIKSRDQKLLD